MAHPIDDYLSDRALTIQVLAARLVINGARKALESLLPGCGATLEQESRRCRIGSVGERDSLIHLESLLRWELVHQQGRRGGRRWIPRRPRKLWRRMCRPGDRRRCDQPKYPEADGLARIDAQNRRRAQPQARRVPAKRLKRATQGQCLWHKLVI